MAEYVSQKASCSNNLTNCCVVIQRVLVLEAYNCRMLQSEFRAASSARLSCTGKNCLDGVCCIPWDVCAGT